METPPREALGHAYSTLVAISQQWDKNHLPGDFFTTPYELGDLIAELAAAMEQMDKVGTLPQLRGKIKFDTTQDLEGFLSYFPQRKCGETPGSFSLGHGWFLHVDGASLTVNVSQVSEELTKELEHLDAIVGKIKKAAPHLEVETWHSGGGIWGILITLRYGDTAFWGTANDQWGADVNDCNGEMLDSLEIPVASELAGSIGTQFVAYGIAISTMLWEMNHRKCDLCGKRAPTKFGTDQGLIVEYCERCHKGMEDAHHAEEALATGKLPHDPSVVGPFALHSQDSDCVIDPQTNLCKECGVLRGDPCPECGGTSFHESSCKQMGEVHPPKGQGPAYVAPARITEA